MRKKFCVLSGLAALAWLNTATVNATTTTVPPGGGLQTALSNANNGDTIQLQAGTYTTVAPNFFVITKSITLVGVGSSSILQVANTVSTGLSINTSNVTVQNLQINAGPAMLQIQNQQNITVSGVTLNTNSSTSGIGANSGNPISVGSSTNVTLSNITLLANTTGTVNNGLDIENSTNVSVSGSTIGSSARGTYVFGGQSVSIQSTSITSSAAEGVLANGAQTLTLSSLTINAGSDGIHIQNTLTATVTSNTITAAQNGIIIEGGSLALVKNNTITQAVNQNGIWLKGTASGVALSNTITRAGQAGINIDTSSSGNIVANNTVTQTDTQNCVNIAQSDSNTVVNNTLNQCGNPSGSRGDGVLVLGGQQNRVERNTLTNYSNDGIVLTQSPNVTTGPTGSGYRGSIGNYVAKNSVTGYPTSGGSATNNQTSRTGIWVNDGSNGTYVFGNTETSANEGGLTVFNANSNILKGNVISANLQAGIYINNQDSSLGFPSPGNNVVQNNYSFNNPTNGEILMHGTNSTDIAYNAFQMISPPSPNGSAGINVSASSGAGGNTDTQVYWNLILGPHQFPTITDGSDNTMTFYENRVYLTASGAFNQAVGGGNIKYDANINFGGNYWSNFSGPTGNPDHFHPYSAFTNPGTGQLAGYTDRYPYASEDFGLSHSITVLAPTASILAAPGSMKTIAWRTQGCVLVDITYSGAASGTIVSNYPDVGIYNWSVPTSLAAGGGYTISVKCKNSSGTALGTSGSSAAFTVPTAGLLLMTPGADLMANAGATVRVSWVKTNGYSGNVNVFLQTTEGGSLSSMASNVSADYVDITLPSVVTSRAKVVIQASSNSAIEDSNDGYISIRGSAPAMVYPTAGTTLLINSVADLEWVSPQGSQFVDIELVTPPGQVSTGSTSGAKDIVFGNLRDYIMNIADRGRVEFIVPERWMYGAHFRLTFRDINGNQLGILEDTPGCSGVSGCTATAPYFDVRYTTATGSLIPLYRLYLAATYEHLYTTDQNEYNVLGTEGWQQESNTIPPNQIVNGNYHINGIQAIPFYRIYIPPILQHLWTTDRNEYLTLRDTSNWSSDPLVGYLFSGSVPGSVPFYRLRYSNPSLPIHLWTTDVNEFNTLTSPNGGWISEGIVGYLYCSPNDTVNHCATSLPAQSSIRTGPVPMVSQLPPLVNESFNWLVAAANRPGPHKDPPFVIHVINQARMQLGEQPVAPGEIVSLMGLRLGPDSPAMQDGTSTSQIATQLANVRVLFDDVAAPVLYASSQEIHVIVPQSVAGKGNVTIQVVVDGDKANPYTVQVAPVMPGVFVGNNTGAGQAAALNQDETANSADYPAVRGSIVALYLTGAGTMAPALPDGTVPTAAQLPQPVLPVAVQIDGIAAEVAYAGAAPGLPGVIQVNARIPGEAHTGSAVPVTITVGEVSAQAGVTIAVK